MLKPFTPITPITPFKPLTPITSLTPLVSLTNLQTGLIPWVAVLTLSLPFTLHPQTVPLSPPSHWSSCDPAKYSTSITTCSGGLCIPVARDGVKEFSNYLRNTHYRQDLTGDTVVEVTLQSLLTGTPLWLSADPQSDQCRNVDGTVMDPMATPYLESVGADKGPASCPTTDPTQFLRWWAAGFRFNLLTATSPTTLTIPLKPEYWYSVCGVNGLDAPAAFQEALKSIRAAGLTIGRGCFVDHGLSIAGVGTATVKVIKMDIR